MALDLIIRQEAPSSLTHAHAYMWAPVPSGSQLYIGVLYIPDVTIGYVTLVVAECAVTNQSRCLKPEVK